MLVGGAAAGRPWGGAQAERGPGGGGPPAAAGLTALAVRAGNLRAGLGAAARGPAVEVSPRVAELARTAAAAAVASSAGAVEDAGYRPVRGAPAPEDAADAAAVRADTQAWADGKRRNLADRVDGVWRREEQVRQTREVIRLFEATGVLHGADMFGRLVPVPDRVLQAMGGAEGAAAAVEYGRQKIPRMEETIRQEWEGIAAYRKDLDTFVEDMQRTGWLA